MSRGALERFLLVCGERVVRVPPKLMAGARSWARERGKSDAIDAVTIARAAIREGLESMPIAQLAGRDLEVRLLVGHRERLVAQRTRLINDLRWGLHDMWPALEIPPCALISARWHDLVGGRLARASQTTRVRIARDELRRIRELTRSINALECELAGLVSELAPRLVAERGCGVLTAAKLIGEIAAIQRSRPTPSSPGWPDQRRSPPPQDAPIATASIAAATANSTASCTAWPSAKAASTPKRPPTWHANRPKAKPATKRCAA